MFDIYSYNDLSNRVDAKQHRCIAIGNFDGVHLGHQAVLEKCVEISKQKELKSTILTFEPHPRAFFNPSTPMQRLTLAHEKKQLLIDQAIDEVIILDFDAALSQLEAENFVLDVLFEKLNAREIFVGTDFHFGKGRKGDVSLLQRLAKPHNVIINAIDKLSNDQSIDISSSYIRNLLSTGCVKEANALLGRFWSFTSQVYHGDKRGRDLGYPTANLHLRKDMNLAFGIYAVRIQYDGNIYGGVASYGRRPVFDNGEPLFEVHIFDFKSEIYGKTLKIELIDWQRPELDFDSVESLITQMDRDSDQARKTLALNI